MNFMMRILPAILIFLAGNGTSAYSNAGEILRINLHSNIFVSGESYRLNDIANIESGSQHEQNILENMIIGISPRVGYLERVSRTDITARVETKIPGVFKRIEWSGAKSVVINRESRIYQSSKYIELARSAIDSYLSKRCKDYSIKIVGEYRDVKLPYGDLHISTKVHSNGIIRKRMSVWLDIFVDNESYRSMLVWFSVDAYDNAWVIKDNLPAGYIIDESELRMQPVNLTESNSRVLSVEKPILGMRLKLPVESGRVLTEDLIEPVPAVFSGQRVQVHATLRAIRVKTVAVALEDGDVGDWIHVRKPGENEKYIAQIVGSGKVAVGNKRYE
jgi:flagella basal body P-ring formation protein FlgA